MDHFCFLVFNFFLGEFHSTAPLQRIVVVVGDAWTVQH